MARPQEFDPEEALAAALGVFQRKGYVGCSLADILEATGLSKSSLYATFGSKHALFLRAFDTYREQRQRLALGQLAQDPARAGIEAYLRRLAAESHVPHRAPDMLLRQALELAWQDGAVRERVDGDFAAVEAGFLEAVTRGLADGSITSPQPAQTLAHSLTVAALGLLVTGHTGLSPAVSEAALAITLGLLDAPAA